MIYGLLVVNPAEAAMSENPVTRAIAAHGVAVGAMLYEFDTPGILRILEAAEVDFALFDLEHSAWDRGSLRALYATGRGSPVYTITRVPTAEYSIIAGVLDAGSDGVMAPMIETRAQAELLAESARYPPLGRRGFGVLFSDQLTEGPAARLEQSNRETLVIAQIETVTGIDNAAEIVGVPGIDAVWLGQFDLTVGLGIPAQFDDPRFVEATEHLIGVCRAAGKPLGQMVSSAEEGRAQRERGFEILAHCDVWVFERAMRDAVRTVRD
jgi:2-keto-3-deoxy-L-rhamnonate aldolase RhmA